MSDTYDTKQISLKEAVKAIRASKIDRPKDMLEGAWNMELERVVRKVIVIAWPDQATRELYEPADFVKESII